MNGGIHAREFANSPKRFSSFVAEKKKKKMFVGKKNPFPGRGGGCQPDGECRVAIRRSAGVRAAARVVGREVNVATF